MPQGKDLEVQRPRTPSVDAENLIAKAIDKDVPIETLEKLLAMRKELKDEAAKEAFFADLAEFQRIVPQIPKSTKIMNKNGTERYSYAKLETIVKKVHTKLFQCGFSYMIKGSQGEHGVTGRVELHHRDGHMEFSEFTIPIDKDAYMTDQQKPAAALTMAKRIAFCNATGIMTADEDTDGNGRSEPTKTPEAKSDTAEQIGNILKDVMKTLKTHPFPPEMRQRWQMKANELVGKQDLKALRSLWTTVENQAKKMKEAARG